MSIYTPSCGTPPAYKCTACPTKELGGIRSIWLQKVSYTFTDIENPAEWDAAICAGNVIPFMFTNGSLALAEQTSQGYGNVPTDLDSYEFTLDVHEPNLENVAFWNFVKRSNQYLVGYKSETKIYLSSVAAKFFPKNPIATDVKTKIDLNIVIKWVQEDIIAGKTAPVGIFNDCVDC